MWTGYLLLGTFINCLQPLAVMVHGCACYVTVIASVSMDAIHCIQIITITPQTGKQLEQVQVHDQMIMDLQMSNDGTHMVSASLDKTAKLLDVQSLQVLKTYVTDRPCNSAAISPTFPHILLGGGQDASQVTTTAARAGKFEKKFYHKVYAEEFGSVRGHFGPINAVAFHPEGTGFSSGGEDGFVRLHHFDPDYFNLKL